NGNTVERVERHLYRVRWRQKNNQWSVYYRAIFRTWDGKRFETRLTTANDLVTARKLLHEYEKLNDERKPLLLEEERKAIEAKRAEEEKANAMTIAKFAPIYRDLPDIKSKDSADRDNQLLDHIVRLMGNKLLAAISRKDLTDYIAARRGETLLRW